ncbi:MAG: hypothetical protein DBX59_01410 [Bacillota bacterium]|nr:MAG: hypothetical protein DBX59_01410 [Bacillota bacterium]
MKAGVGGAVISFSPRLFPLEGFVGIHDLPHAGVLLLEQEERVALISVEIVMLPDSLIDKCRRETAAILGTKPEKVWLHMTHTISTPHAPAGPQVGLGGEVLARDSSESEDDDKQTLYEEAIREAIRAATMQALEGLAPAELGFGQAICPLLQQRDIETPEGWWIGPSGTTTEELLSVLAVRNSTGHLSGILLNYAMKPCVIDNAWLNIGRRQISADGPGCACRLLEAAFGVPVLYTMGAAADLLPRKTAWFDRVTQKGEIETVDLGVDAGLEFVSQIGKQLAEEVDKILGHLTWTKPERLAVGMDSFSWPGKARTPMHPCRKADFRPADPAVVPVEVILLGSVALVGGKPEMNAISAGQLRQVSPCPYTLFLGMVNGGMKYMPDLRSYQKPTWEALASPLMPGAAEKFVAQAAGLITKLYREEPLTKA